jgi:hypothetical protein
MNKKENEVLFEIQDYDYGKGKLVGPIFGIFLILILLSVGASFDDKGLYTLETLVYFTIGGSIASLLGLIFFYKDRKIVFYKNKIVLKQSKNIQEEINILDIEEVYKLLPYHAHSNTANKLFRWNIKSKIAIVFLLPLLLVATSLYYISDFIFYRSFLFKRYRFILIGKTDNDFLVISYTGSEQRVLEEYFKNIIDIDVNKLKPNYWFFIPQN